MVAGAVPSDESRRLRAVRDLGVLDSAPEERFDRIARVTARALDVPAAIIVFADGERECLKARVGLGALEAPGLGSLSTQAISEGACVVVQDTTVDARFSLPRLPGAHPEARFAAAHPVQTRSGERVGALCVFDTVPRTFGARDRACLRDLAACVDAELSRSEVEPQGDSARHAEVRWRALMDTIPDAIASFGEDGVIRMVNAAAERIFGWKPGTLVGERVDVLLADRSLEQISTALGMGGTPRLIGESARRFAQHHDGSHFPMEFVIGETEIDGERVFVVVAQDIRSQLEWESLTRETEDRFRAIFDNVSLGITLSDSVGALIVDANAAFADLVGYPLEQIRGLTHGALARPDDLAEVQPKIDAWLQAGGQGSVRGRLRLLRSDGTQVWATVTLSAVLDETGSVPRSVVAIFEDITARMEIERTRAELISVVGHELRTPLTSIRGSLGLIDAGVLGPLPAEAAEMLSVALTNTERLVRLVNDILDLERIDAGRLELAPVNVSARTLVDQSVAVVQTEANEAHILLAVDGPDTIVHADPQLVTQVLVNLLGNAMKFSPSDSTVTITLARNEAACTVSVTDSGRGIPADQLDSVFERFNQVDASDAREKGGTGLGLAIAQRIVERHGGRIWAESPPTGGCTMRFTLPTGG